MKRRLTTILPSFILLVPSSFGASSFLFIKSNFGISSKNDNDRFLQSINQLKQSIKETERQIEQLKVSEKRLNDVVCRANLNVISAQQATANERKKVNNARNAQDNNLLDDTVYYSELSKIDKEKEDNIAEEKNRIENDANQKRQSILNSIRNLRAVKKKNQFTIPSGMLSAVSSINNKRQAWEDFFNKPGVSDKAQNIMDRITGISDSDIEGLAAGINSTSQLINLCDSVETVGNGGEPNYKDKDLNKKSIPLAFAITTAVTLIIVFASLDWDFSWAESVGSALAGILLHAFFIGLFGLFAYLMSNAFEHEVMGFFGMLGTPILMLIVLIYNNWEQNVGFFSWLGSIILVILLGVFSLILFGISLNECYEETTKIIICGIIAALAFWWLRLINLRTDDTLVDIGSFAAEFSIPIGIGVIVFFLVRYLFTQTKIGEITVRSERERNISSILWGVQNSIYGFKVLFNYKEIGKYVQNKENIEKLNKDIERLNEATLASIEQSKRVIYADLQTKIDNLDIQRQKQREEKDAAINALVQIASSAYKREQKAVSSLEDAKRDVEANQMEIMQKKEVLEQKNKKLKKDTQSLSEKINSLDDIRQEIANYEEEVNKSKEQILEIKEQLQEMAKALTDTCNDSLEETKGKLCDSIFLYVSTENSDDFLEFRQIKHNADKLVLIYDENEIENNNLSKSLSPYIDWIAAAFCSVNNPREILENYKFKIIDVTSGARHYIGGDLGRAFEAFGDATAINNFEKKTTNQVDEIIDWCTFYKMSDVDIVDLNQTIYEAAKKEDLKFGKDEKNKRYIITFILIPNIENSEIIPASLWKNLNDCRRFGIMPIFLVGGNTWNEMDKNSQLKVQVKRENIYYISGGKTDKMKISSLSN